MLRARTTTGIVATAMALASPAVAGAQRDLRSPDAIDTADRSAVVVKQQDLRTPDAQEAARTPTPSMQVTTARVALPQISPESGFQWGDAGIGAAGMLGVIGIVAGGALTLRRRGDRVAL